MTLPPGVSRHRGATAAAAGARRAVGRVRYRGGSAGGGDLRPGERTGEYGCEARNAPPSEKDAKLARKLANFSLL